MSVRTKNSSASRIEEYNKTQPSKAIPVVEFRRTTAKTKPTRRLQSAINSRFPEVNPRRENSSKVRPVCVLRKDKSMDIKQTSKVDCYLEKSFARNEIPRPYSGANKREQIKRIYNSKLTVWKNRTFVQRENVKAINEEKPKGLYEFMMNCKRNEGKVFEDFNEYIFIASLFIRGEKNMIAQNADVLINMIKQIKEGTEESKPKASMWEVV